MFAAIHICFKHVVVHVCDSSSSPTKKPLQNNNDKRKTGISNYKKKENTTSDPFRKCFEEEEEERCGDYLRKAAVKCSASPNPTFQLGSSTRSGIGRGVGFGLQRLGGNSGGLEWLIQCKAEAWTRAFHRFKRESASPVRKFSIMAAEE
jgi:hypothetical protein